MRQLESYGDEDLSLDIADPVDEYSRTSEEEDKDVNVLDDGDGEETDGDERASISNVSGSKTGIVIKSIKSCHCHWIRRLGRMNPAPSNSFP